MMLGVPAGTRPQTAGEKHFVPVEALGLQTMSMGYLIDDNTPMVWRGPMAGSALQQLLTQTQWNELDILLIDMPPGTGDIQLTLSQRAAVDGAVIVTTPQNIALLDAKKGIEMFAKVDIPVLGVVENMSTHICSNCGHEEAIFGTKLLGRIPLASQIRAEADAGTPTVHADPESDYAQRFREIARTVIEDLASAKQAEVPFFNIMDD